LGVNCGGHVYVAKKNPLSTHHFRIKKVYILVPIGVPVAF
jgi:hypothetical protein